METLTTKGIQISVEVFYDAANSNPDKHKFFFTYRVTIENKSQDTVQLLDRHWYIADSALLGFVKEVEGPGVIGKQPTLEPGEFHQYESWSPLKSELGKMHGYYTMQRAADGKKFKVRIPEFKLVASYVLN